ncbi:MAG: hypothetical protein JXR05_15690 [Flavobacteriaceae bacterium]
MKKIIFLFCCSFIISCASNQNLNKREIKTLKRETFEVNYFSNWTVTKLKGYLKYQSVSIFNKNSSFSALSGIYKCRENESLTEIYTKMLTKDRLLHRSDGFKGKVYKGFIEIVGDWDYANQRRKITIRYYKRGTNVYRILFSSSNKNIEKYNSERKLFFDSFKMKES